MADFNSVLYRVLGEKIKERREELGLSQQELSDKILKLGRTSISNIEKGRQFPPLSTIYELCRALDIDVQRILPTYSEVEAEANSSPENDKIEKYFNTLNLDQKTMDQLRKALKKG